MQIVIAIVTGVAVLVAGNLPWAGFGPLAGLAVWNLREWVAVPWAVVPMAVYLWAYWRFISGAWGADGADERRINLNAHRVTGRVWVASLAAGAVGFAALLVWLSLVARFVSLPSSAPIATPPGMPLVTALLLLSMSSVVAGVTEEAAFRGYMQSIVERSHGLGIAILVNGLMFGLLHFGNHPDAVVLMLPYYVAVSAVYGGLTWAAGSILPALVLHSAGDVVVLTRWWRTGMPEWQLTTAPPAPVWVSGIDAPLVLTSLLAFALTGLTALAFRHVRSMRRSSAAVGAEIA